MATDTSSWAAATRPVIADAAALLAALSEDPMEFTLAAADINTSGMAITNDISVAYSPNVTGGKHHRFMHTSLCVTTNPRQRSKTTSARSATRRLARAFLAVRRDIA
ncbi:hypothetical protein MSIMFI_05577 [Mycobacterium simulans]|nr:hypothetical protein MSIMFI_05577 [Mycobacterium simulans]